MDIKCNSSFYKIGKILIYIIYTRRLFRYRRFIKGDFFYVLDHNWEALWEDIGDFGLNGVSAGVVAREGVYRRVGGDFGVNGVRAGVVER